MAKVRLPLMSGDARGQFGADLMFRGGTGGTRVYRPADRTKINQAPPSAAQTAVRTHWNQALTAWRALTEGERSTWNQTAETDRRAVNGWNLFLAAWGQAEPYDYDACPTVNGLSMDIQMPPGSVTRPDGLTMDIQMP